MKFSKKTSTIRNDKYPIRIEEGILIEYLRYLKWRLRILIS